MKKSILMSSLLAAMAMADARAYAQDAPKRGFRESSRAEAVARAAQRFDDADADHDGKLSQSEMRAAHERARAKRGLTAKSQDGAPRANAPTFELSRADALARASQRFDKADLNRDGRVEADEARASMHKRHEGRSHQPAEPMTRPPHLPQ